MNNSEIAHMWAHNSDETKSRKGSSFYFDGLTIYSYGPHFPIARHVTHKGSKAILFTTDTRSVTTARHCSLTRQAIPHDIVFHVAYVKDKPESTNYRKQYQARLNCVLDDASRARANKPHYIEAAQQIIDEARTCAEFFGWSWRLKADLDQLIAESKAQAEKQKAKDKANRERFDKLQAQLLPYWREHAKAPEHLAENFSRVAKSVDTGRHAHLRLSVDRQTVETSKGAKVPVSDAPALWQAIRLAKRSKVACTLPFTVGTFTVNEIEPTGDMRVGCHFIPYAESEYIAKELAL